FEGPIGLSEEARTRGFPPPPFDGFGFVVCRKIRRRTQHDKQVRMPNSAALQGSAGTRNLPARTETAQHQCCTAKLFMQAFLSLQRQEPRRRSICVARWTA